VDAMEASVRIAEAVIARLPDHVIIGAAERNMAEEAGGKYGELFTAIYRAVWDVQDYRGEE